MDIKGIVINLEKKYGTREPFELAQLLNVLLLEVPLIKCNGFYQYYKRNHIIYIDSSLSYIEKRIVLAHELGHLLLHPRTNSIYLSTYTRLVTQKLENEADKFASELLISDEMFEQYKDITINDLAKILKVHPKHIQFKYEGYNKNITKT